MDNNFKHHELVYFYKQIGLKKGDVVFLDTDLSLVFTSFRTKLKVIEALYEVLGLEGTIIFKDFDKQNSLNLAQLDHNFLEDSYDIQSCFDYNYQHYFKDYPNFSYSNHPKYRFLAIGYYAKYICDHQSYDFGLGLNSPLSKLLNLSCKVLVLNDHYSDSATMYHGYQRCGYAVTITETSKDPITEHFIKYLDNEIDQNPLHSIGLLLEDLKLVQKFNFEKLTISLFIIDDLISISEKYFEYINNNLFL